MSYEFLEDIAVADIAFRAWGKGLETTFAEAGDAVMNVMVEDLESIEIRAERAIQLENDGLDMLLLPWICFLMRHTATFKILTAGLP